jgi:pantoate--beta-alanine ligase
MKTVITIPELQQALAVLERPQGFVPTMGYLHEGHLSLVRRARQENATVVVSIFANPTQFGPDEDLDSYPRDIDQDLELLSGAGADLVWIPSVQVMYPDGFQSWVEVEALTKVLEGAYRPTHFRGVTTVVAKLFNAVGPERAYFGQKDAQQAAVLKQMVRDLNFQVKMVICPIVREPDGLAMSSRNTYLTVEERQAALCLSRGLSKAQEAFQEGIQDAELLRDIVRKEIDQEELAELQYVSCADPETLQELDGHVERCLVSMAVYVGRTRLIDNRLLGS